MRMNFSYNDFSVFRVESTTQTCLLQITEKSQIKDSPAQIKNNIHNKIGSNKL
jgi:hypothetical protein